MYTSGRNIILLSHIGHSVATGSTPVVQPRPPVVQPRPPVVQPRPPVVQPRPPVVQPRPPVVQPRQVDTHCIAILVVSLVPGHKIDSTPYLCIPHYR